MIRIGTAGWSLPRALAEEFPGGGAHLARYAARFDSVEINSSFYRPHRRTTYARWAATVPDAFRFAVKLPRAITHERRLIDCAEPIDGFGADILGLGAKRGPVLVQLPPSLAFDPDIAAAFFTELHRRLGGAIVCEPRHASWFEPHADALLAAHRVARVAADPARVPAAAVPGGWLGLSYQRLHGTPVTYRSRYDADAVAAHRATASAASDAWVIYDNTTLGAATANALELRAAVTEESVGQ